MELVVGPWIQDTKGVFPLAVLTDFRREFSIASRRLRLYAVEREVAESPDELDAAVLRHRITLASFELDWFRTANPWRVPKNTDYPPNVRVAANALEEKHPEQRAQFQNLVLKPDLSGPWPVVGVAGPAAGTSTSSVPPPSLAQPRARTPLFLPSPSDDSFPDFPNTDPASGSSRLVRAAAPSGSSKPPKKSEKQESPEPPLTQPRRKAAATPSTRTLDYDSDVVMVSGPPHRIPRKLPAPSPSPSPSPSPTPPGKGKGRAVPRKSTGPVTSKKPAVPPIEVISDSGDEDEESDKDDEDEDEEDQLSSAEYEPPAQVRATRSASARGASAQSSKSKGASSAPATRKRGREQSAEEDEEEGDEDRRPSKKSKAS